MQMRINIPPLTRILLGLLLTISIVHQATRFVFHTPTHQRSSQSFRSQSVYYPWVYVTASFAEQNVVTLLIAGATIFYGGKYLERAWGSTEFGKFVLIVTLIPNFCTSLVYIFWFAITRDPDRAWTYIQGSVAFQGAFLVAFKQLVPEHTVTLLKGVAKIRVKHFPAIFLAANTISGLLFATDSALILAWTGFYTSWIYLRFFKQQPDFSGAVGEGSGLKGDASETFTFASFWPDVVQPPIVKASDLVYNLMVTAHIIHPFSAEEIETSNVQASARGEGGLHNILTQGARREESEKRRNEDERSR